MIIAGINEDSGPFDHGDMAILLPDEVEPLTDADLDRALQIASYSRRELLIMVQGLNAATLDLKGHIDEMSIREILRHIGNVEQWYVSRLYPPDELPPEWEADGHLPIFEFLEMERRTVVEQLRSLPERAREEIFYPTAWTRHPDEPWTARKALRGVLEHEREHIGQIHDIVASLDTQ